MNDDLTIPAEAVASRLANTGAKGLAWFACGHRRNELLWFLQWQSLQPRGLVKFAADVTADFPQNIGTGAMRHIGKTSAPYTVSEREEVAKSVSEYECDDRRVSLEEMCSLSELGNGMRVSRRPCGNEPPILDKSQNYSHFYNVCQAAALVLLPELLARFCQQPGACLEDPWCFHGLEAALIQAVDAHAQKVLKSIAPTSVVKIIFDTLDFALAEKAMVEISGSSRYGKTQGGDTFCAAFPGLARLVKVPSDNTDRGLLEAIAQAFGWTVGLHHTTRQVKSAIEHLCRCTGFLLVFDEAHYLFPQRYTKTTTPMRLNYVRQLLDNGNPVALLKTPQFEGAAAQRFQNKTGFNLTQWKARIMRTVSLPEELPSEDLIAVVKHQMPGLRESLARRVVGAALIDSSFMFGVEKIAKNSRAVARKNGRVQITSEDLENGIALAGIRMPGLAGKSALPPAPSPAPRHAATSNRREVAPPSMPTRAAATTAQLLGIT